MTATAVRHLVLLRYAKSAWPDNVPDHDRPLARRGRHDAPPPDGRFARPAIPRSRPVLHSPPDPPDMAARTSRTRRAADRRRRPSGLRSVRGQPARPGPPAAAATRTLMVVGHDPALPELAGAGRPRSRHRVRADAGEVTDRRNHGSGAQRRGPSSYPAAHCWGFRLAAAWRAQPRPASTTISEDSRAGTLSTDQFLRISRPTALAAIPAEALCRRAAGG